MALISSFTSVDILYLRYKSLLGKKLSKTNELQEEYFNKAAEIFPNMQWEIVDGATHAFSGKAGERALEKCLNYLNENID